MLRSQQMPSVLSPVLLWQFRMGLNNDKFLPFLDLNAWKCYKDSSHITKQYFAANGDRLNSQITKLLHELHFTNTFHDKNLYIFAFKMLLTRLCDTSNFAVPTLREHWSIISENLACCLYTASKFSILHTER